MLIYGSSFLESNADALRKLNEKFGDNFYRVAIEIAPDMSEDEVCEEEPKGHPMKPAVKTALAYLHTTGYFPKSIHLETFMEVHKRVEDIPRNVKIDGEIITIHDKKVKDEFLREIEDHPFVIGDKMMKERGFTRRRLGPRRSSRTIEYYGPETEEGYITREGKGCWIWTRNERGGMNTEKFDVI